MNPRNDMLRYLEQAMDALAEGRSGDVMIPLWRVHQQLRQVDIQPRRAFGSEMDRIALMREAQASIALDGDTYSLPPMKPRKKQKPKRLPMGSTIGVPCPRCGAKAYEPCFGFTMAGKNGVVDPNKTIATYHTARTEKAKVSKRAIPQQAFEAAPIVIPLDEV